MADRGSRLLLTQEGERELVAEVASLEEVRGDILRESLRSSGPSQEALRNELGVIEEQIRRLLQTLASGTQVGNTGFEVAVGSEVTVVDQEGRKKTFTIGGPLAANPHFACLSYESPMARALLGHELGDVVDVVSAQGRQQWKIVGLRAGRPEVAQTPRQLEPTTAGWR